MNEKLLRSKFRTSFYLTEQDVAYVERISLEKIKEHAKEFITRRLAPQFPYNDGKQTPYKGHPVFKAQHATATCCRGCLQKWHNIPKGNQLTEQEIDHVVHIILEWIKEKIKRRFYLRGTTNSATANPMISPPTPITTGTSHSVSTR